MNALHFAYYHVITEASLGKARGLIAPSEVRLVLLSDIKEISKIEFS